MKFAIRPGYKHSIPALVLAAAYSLAFAGADPDPTRVHFVGPIPWSIDPIQCAGLGSDPILVETYIEELRGIQLGQFNTGFGDGSGGWHLVQPARWTMSAVSLSGTYSWWGRVAGHAVRNLPSQTSGGNFNFLVNAMLESDGDWPDLRLQLTVRFVIDAKGELRVFDDMLEFTCMN